MAQIAIEYIVGVFKEAPYNIYMVIRFFFGSILTIQKTLPYGYIFLRPSFIIWEEVALLNSLTRFFINYLFSVFRS